MNKKEALKLARTVSKDTNGVVIVDELLHYGEGSYSLACRDMISGYRFQVHSREAWEERMDGIRADRESELI